MPPMPRFVEHLMKLQHSVRWAGARKVRSQILFRIFGVVSEANELTCIFCVALNALVCSCGSV